MNRPKLRLSILPIIALAVPLALDQGSLQGATDQIETEAPLSAGMFQRESIGPAPSSLVLDQARMFDDQEFNQLSARLKEFGAQNNVIVYVAAYSVLIGESLDERAGRLRESWLDGKRGIILVYQRGTQRMTFSSSADPESFVGRGELARVFSGAYRAASTEERAADRVISAANSLLADLPAAIAAQQHANQLTDSETRSFVGWALGGIVAIAAISMFAFQLLRRAQVQVTKSYTFPHIRAEERFGAPYSGGHHAEIQFTASSRP